VAASAPPTHRLIVPTSKTREFTHALINFIIGVRTQTAQLGGSGALKNSLLLATTQTQHDNKDLRAFLLTGKIHTIYHNLKNKEGSEVSARLALLNGYRNLRRNTH
jgi:hypothetical protein